MTKIQVRANTLKAKLPPEIEKILPNPGFSKQVSARKGDKKGSVF